MTKGEFISFLVAWASSGACGLPNGSSDRPRKVSSGVERWRDVQWRLLVDNRGLPVKAKLQQEWESKVGVEGGSGSARCGCVM